MIGPPAVIVFDLFHTLVDPEDFRPRSFHREAHAASLLGIELASFLSHWEATEPVRLCTPTRPVDQVRDLLTMRGRPVFPSLLEAVDRGLGVYQDLALLRPRREVVAAVARLAGTGIRLGLLSNAHERDVRMWSLSPLSGYFAATHISCFTGVAKPDPAAYAALLTELGARAGDAAFVADGSRGELEAAVAAGFGDVVLVTGPALRSGLRSRDEVDALAVGCDGWVDEVDELVVRYLGPDSARGRRGSLQQTYPATGARCASSPISD